MANISINKINKFFGNVQVIKDVSLDIKSQSFTVLVGPSGCGKSTMLRMIAGLEDINSGTISIDGQVVNDLPPKQRNIAMVFQSYALYPHMTVFDNIAFGLRVRPRATRPSEAEIKKRVTRLLDLVQLGFLADRYPAQLSGGQRQRIALARALAVEPRVLLLDEPFGALDAKVRKELRRWLRTLHDELHITSIFVTHDQEEALEVADQIIVMNKGDVEQIGSPRQVYEKPATPFVFDFLGQANRFEGEHSNGIIHIDENRIQLPNTVEAPQGKVIAFARPNELHIHTQPQNNTIEATFLREVWIAGKVIAELQDRSGRTIEILLSVEEANLHQFKPNQTVWISATQLHLFADQTTQVA